MFAPPFLDLPQHATLRRIALLRLLALACQGAGLLLAEFFLGVELPLLALSAVLLVGAGFLGWTVWRMRHPQPLGSSGLFAQLLLDLLNWSALLYLCGGATNPFVSFYLAILAVAAAILPGRLVAMLAVLSLLAYSLLSYFYLPLQLANSEQAVNYHLAGMWVNFALSACVIAWFVTRISATLRMREVQLAQARERQLQHAQVLALGTQAANSAHALATPLATIAVLVGELRHATRHDENLAHYAEDLAQIENQLAQCQIGLEKMRVKPIGAASENMALSDWLAEFLASWRLQHPQQVFQIALPKLLGQLDCQRQNALMQILTILLDNAGKAAPHAPIHIDVEQDDQADHACRIRITDTGGGIAVDLLARLGHAPVTSSTGGQGIGIWLATVTTQQIGAKLQFFSTVGIGTTALLELEMRA